MVANTRRLFRRHFLVALSRPGFSFFCPRFFFGRSGDSVLLRVLHCVRDSLYLSRLPVPLPCSGVISYPPRYANISPLGYVAAWQKECEKSARQSVEESQTADYVRDESVANGGDCRLRRGFL